MLFSSVKSVFLYLSKVSLCHVWKILSCLQKIRCYWCSHPLERLLILNSVLFPYSYQIRSVFFFFLFCRCYYTKFICIWFWMMCCFLVVVVVIFICATINWCCYSYDIYACIQQFRILQLGLCARLFQVIWWDWWHSTWDLTLALSVSLFQEFKFIFL
jgi:hypothetical protein